MEPHLFERVTSDQRDADSVESNSEKGAEVGTVFEKDHAERVIAFSKRRHHADTKNLRDCMLWCLFHLPSYWYSEILNKNRTRKGRG